MKVHGINDCRFTLKGCFALTQENLLYFIEDFDDANVEFYGKFDEDATCWTTIEIEKVWHVLYCTSDKVSVVGPFGGVYVNAS